MERTRKQVSCSIHLRRWISRLVHDPYWLEIYSISGQKDVIREKFREYEQNTCIKLVEWPTRDGLKADDNRIVIKNGGSCNAMIGRRGEAALKEQPLILQE